MKSRLVLAALAIAAFPAHAAITYLDAEEGASGNTFATGGSLADTSWVGPNSSSVNATQWNKREGIGDSNGPAIFQGSSTTTPPPELTTTVTGLTAGTYTIWAFFWDQIDSGTQNWVLSAGLTSGSLATYSAPGEPVVAGATTINVEYAGNLSFASSVNVDGFNDGNPTLLRQLFGINLGDTVVSGGTVGVFIGNDILTGGSNRAWYEGVGYELVPEPSSSALLGLAALALCRRRRN
jgi:hypothetical protein